MMIFYIGELKDLERYGYEVSSSWSDSYDKCLCGYLKYIEIDKLTKEIKLQNATDCEGRGYETLSDKECIVYIKDLIKDNLVRLVSKDDYYKEQREKRILEESKRYQECLKMIDDILKEKVNE